MDCHSCRIFDVKRPQILVNQASGGGGRAAFTRWRWRREHEGHPLCQDGRRRRHGWAGCEAQRCRGTCCVILSAERRLTGTEHLDTDALEPDASRPIEQWQRDNARRTTGAVTRTWYVVPMIHGILVLIQTDSSKWCMRCDKDTRGSWGIPTPSPDDPRSLAANHLA